MRGATSDDRPCRDGMHHRGAVCNEEVHGARVILELDLVRAGPSSPPNRVGPALAFHDRVARTVTQKEPSAQRKASRSRASAPQMRRQ